MKRLLLIIITFIMTFAVIYFLGDAMFGGAPSPNTLQAAVTFNGINFLALFVYVLLALIATTIIYFSLIHKHFQTKG